MTCFPYIVCMVLQRGGMQATVKSPGEPGRGFLVRMRDPFVGKVLLGNAVAPRAPMPFDVILGDSKYRCEYSTRRTSVTGESGEAGEIELEDDRAEFFIPIDGAMTLRGARTEPVRFVACGKQGRFVYFQGGASLLQRPYGLFERSVAMRGFDAGLIRIASVASVAIQSLNVLEAHWRTV